MTQDRIRRLTATGALVAVLLVMSATPLGYLRVNPAMTLTLLMAPVIVGAVMMGKWCGAILGAVFGLTSFAQCFGADPLGAILLAANPFAMFVTCVMTRALAGFLVGAVFVGLKKLSKDREMLWQFGAAGLIGSLLNTVLFLGTMVAFFHNVEDVRAGLLPIIGGLIALNGTVEAAACAVIGGVVIAATKRAVKTFQ